MRKTHPEAILTSMGFTDAALTWINSSSGFAIVGTGMVASWYSVGLQYFVRAIARIVRGVWVAISMKLVAIF